MIVGLGLDVVEVKQIADNLNNETYRRKVFTPAEVADCQGIAAASERFAGKFAAKEACMKALGKGIQQGVWFTDIEVLHQDSGQPALTTTRTAHDRLQELAVTRIHVSLSHTAGFAVAVVVLEN